MINQVRETLFRAITNQINYAVKRGDTEEQVIGQAMDIHMDNDNYTIKLNNEIADFIKNQYQSTANKEKEEQEERKQRDDIFYKAMIETLVSREDKGAKFIEDLTKALDEKEKKEKKEKGEK